MEGDRKVYIGDRSPSVYAVTGDSGKSWTNAAVNVKPESMKLSVGKVATVK